jgi:HEPN domain-containing protein
MVERSTDWIDQAEGDLEHAKHDLKSGFCNWACFSAQQSAEKAVKAVLQKLGAEAWVAQSTIFWFILRRRSLLTTYY